MKTMQQSKKKVVAGNGLGRILAVCLCAVFFTVAAAAADGNTKKNKASDNDAKELSGMSIVGNDEAPKSLYIVPWKSSEIGVETSLRMLLNENDVPVDRDVFKRQLEFYKVRSAK